MTGWEEKETAEGQIDGHNQATALSVAVQLLHFGTEVVELTALQLLQPAATIPGAPYSSTPGSSARLSAAT